MALEIERSSGAVGDRIALSGLKVVDAKGLQ